ncbi:hypothetical protein H0264_14535 [Nocardia huaxiensis]|uniref:Uncharacterized protein n=1 Tax=Nocardia huaxiensis TaxID=2755382 RepID=A0A7D6ZT80_9NOCA|nr:hypothetical protein [Nocardia huaxiensis]QLY33285.1 hypothetical protein H0264_14535 [Nocardia huaxiensis]
MTEPKQSRACGCGETSISRGMCKPCYDRHRYRQIAYNRWNPRTSADIARTHLQRLQTAGISPHQVAQMAGLGHATVARITHPEWERISTEVETAILGIEVPDRAADVLAPTALVPVLGARRRVQALIAHGYPQRTLADSLGVHAGSRTMSALVGRSHSGGGISKSITAERERAVRALFDRLQMTPGPSDRARAYGRQRGWPLPFEWDEDTIDQPDGTPVRARWTPASSREERREQVRALTGLGLPASQIADRLGMTTRLVERDRHATLPTPARPEWDWGVER